MPRHRATSLLACPPSVLAGSFFPSTRVIAFRDQTAIPKFASVMNAWWLVEREIPFKRRCFLGHIYWCASEQVVPTSRAA